MPAVAPPTVDSKLSLHVDLLGALQFGLAPTLELGRTWTGYARLRAINTGLASYFLLTRDDEDRFDWGVGAAAGVHRFSDRGQIVGGLFGGAALEYAFVSSRDRKRDRARHGTHALIPQLDLGYRWVLRRWLVAIGGRVGLAVPVAAFDHPLPPRGCRSSSSCDGQRSIWFLPTAFLDIGWML